MQHYWSLHHLHINDAWVTIGSFDGVHRGHQQIVQHMVAAAHQQGAPAVVLTFYPHPAVVLGRRSEAFYLTTPEERAEILGALGVDYVITHPFNQEVAHTSAYDFLNYLKKHLGFTQLWVGFDFALGHKREGNVARLQELSAEFNYSLQVIEPIESGGEVISSSRIRKALESGDVRLAAELLGRPYSIVGEVIHGDGRGRLLGFPTANLKVWQDRALPKAGVYICRAQVNGQTWGAVTNVGVRPTFENQPAHPLVEPHLLDFDQDLYDQQIQLSFLERIRDEQRFPNVEALVAQVQADIEQGRQFLAELP